MNGDRPPNPGHVAVETDLHKCLEGTAQKVRRVSDGPILVNLTRVKGRWLQLALALVLLPLLPSCPAAVPSLKKTTNLLLEPGAFDGTHRRTLTFINNVDRYSLNLPPGESSTTLNPVQLGQRSRLTVGLGLLRTAWETATTGVEFRILAAEKGSGDQAPPADHPSWIPLVEKLVHPRDKEEDRRWLDIDVDLSRFDNKELFFQFESRVDQAPNSVIWPVVFSNPEVTSESARPERGEEAQVDRIIFDLIEGRIQGVSGRPEGVPPAELRGLAGSEDGGFWYLPARPGESFKLHLTIEGNASLTIGGAITSPRKDSSSNARFTVTLNSDETSKTLTSRVLSLGKPEIFDEEVAIPSPSTPGPRDITLEFSVSSSIGASGDKDSDLSPTGWTRARLTTSYPVLRRKESRKTPSVLILLADTLRADHLSSYGYKRKTTPVLDQLASGGIRFSACTSPASWTLPSVASLFTGTSPPSHGVETIGRANLAQGFYTLAEVFQDAGYATGGFVANGLVSHHVKFDQGFSTFDSLPNRRAEQVIDRFLDWLPALSEDEAFLGYLHFMDPHGPYAPPEPELTRFAEKNYSGDITPEFLDTVRLEFQTQKREQGVNAATQKNARELAAKVRKGNDHFINRYDGEIAYMDRQIGRLLQELKKRGRLSNTIVVFTSDHGEGFFEHGTRGHGKNIYQEVVGVPLILSWPGELTPAVCDSPVQITSILPTLSYLADVRRPETTIQTNLRSVARTGVSPKLQYIVIESGRLGKHRDVAMNGVMQGPFKYIETLVEPLHRELYNLKEDPGEKHNLLSGTPTSSSLEKADSLAGSLAAWIKKEESSAPNTAAADDQTKKMAEDLGYLHK